MSNSKRTIAVVDDDIRLLESLENLLESAGYEVRMFSSGADLLKRGFGDIDGLITDIGMPGMDGFQLREQVLKARPGLPIFLVTGRHEIAQRVAELSVASLLFRKPIDGQLLLAAVDKAFKATRGDSC